MYGKQNAAIFHSAFVSLGLVFRNSHSNQGSGNSTDGATNARARKGGDNRPSGNKRSQSRYRQCTNTQQPPHCTAEDDSCSRARCSSFWCLGTFLVRKIS